MITFNPVKLFSRIRYSLKYRIAVIIFLLEALMMATVLGVTLSYSMEESRKQRVETEQVMLNLLADLGRIALLTAEYDELQPYVEKVVNDPTVSAVVLADSQDKIVVSNRYSYFGRQIPKFINDETRHWASVEIRNSTGKIGTLAIQFSEENMLQTNQEVMNLGITIALLGMFSIAIIGFLIGYLLTRRLEILTNSAKQLASGNLAVRTNFSGKDEVSIVGRAFDRMATNVSENMTALQKATDLLELRVSERTEELAIARDDAINANRSKSHFLANMSHEIRTPLTAIIGYSESMLENDLDKKEQEESLTTVIRSSRHLLQIINDILDLSKVEAEKMEIEILPIHTFPFLNEIQSLIGIQAKAKNISFDIEYAMPLPDKIHSDPVRLKQVLLNVISNAIKFTQQGSVRLIVSCDIEQQQMHFKIIDTGIGMDNEQQQKLFLPFTQADSSTTRKFGGTGLGLYLSSQLVEKLGGTITVKSTLDVGSCFDIAIQTGELSESQLLNSVPVQCDVENIIQHKQVRQSEKNLSGRVLLAEDNPDNQRLVAMLIRQMGAIVDIADNGRKAVNMAIANPYELVLMDMHMPIMGGIEAVRELRKHGYDKPIYSLSANAMQDELQQCKQAGCDGQITKPIDRIKFREVLQSCLQNTENKTSIEPPIISPILEEEPDLLEILEMFINRLPGMLTNICEAHESKNYAELGELIHDMKGTCGNFGYDALYELSIEIENLIRAKEYSQISVKLIDVEKLTQRILRGFHERVTPLSQFKK